MRIVVSGTHASGKTTLIAEFADLHPRVVVELVGGVEDRVGALEAALTTSGR